MQRTNLSSSRGFARRSTDLFFGLTLASAASILIGAFIPDAQATSLFRFENRRENPGALRLLPELTMLSTKENYDATGAKVPATALTSYKKTGLDITGVYGVNRKLSVFGRISMASISFDTSPTVTETNGLNGQGSGLTEQGLGANYRLWESTPTRLPDGSVKRGSSIDGQLQLDIPLYDNVSSRSTRPRLPLRGDGSFDITFAGFGTMPLNQGAGTRMYLLGGLGLTMRNNNYSKAIPYQLQFVGLPERSGLLYRAGFHGFKSMTSDTGGVTALSPQAVTGSGIDPYDAGRSLIVDALNSSYMTFRATLGYQWGIGDQVYGTYIMPLSGTSTAALSGFMLGAQFRFQAGPTAAASTPRGTQTAGAARLAYDLEGHVKQANDKLNLIKIDIGEADGVEKGNIIDIYRVNPNGTPADLVARGIVTGVSGREAVVNLRQYKKEVWVQAGFLARRVTPKKP